MKLRPVKSSLIKAIGLDGNTMHIEFHKGGVYRYTGPLVPDHHAALTSAESVGKHFLRAVKNCPHTRCEKL